MRLIVGLGNPGNKYQRTRHNVGFMIIDRLAERHGMNISRARFHGQLCDGQIAGNRCLLLKPMTYMNQSGLAVASASCFYKLAHSDLIIVVDDTAMPAGRIRLRATGSDGGHNGLADIAQALGSNVYPRLRIGIDPPGTIPQVDYVLGQFTSDQRQNIEPALDTACDAIDCWINHGIEEAMNRHNG